VSMDSLVRASALHTSDALRINSSSTQVIFERYNMELSCAAASDQLCMECRMVCTDSGGLLGDNCSDLL